MRRLKDKGLLSLLARLRSRRVSIEPQKRSAEAPAGFVPREQWAIRGPRCFNSVSKHTPTLLRAGTAGLPLSLSLSLSLSLWIRLTCGICSASETSRRESCARSLAEWKTSSSFLRSPASLLPFSKRIFSHTKEAIELSSLLRSLGSLRRDEKSNFRANYRRYLAGLLATMLGGDFHVTYPSRDKIPAG